MKKDLEEIIDFRYRSDYESIDEFRKRDGYWSVFSESLKETDCNHLIPCNGTNCRDLLISSKPEFLSHSRVPCIYTTPLSFENNDQIDGLERAAAESFMYYGRDVPPAVQDAPDFRIERIGKDRMREYVDSFYRSFSDGPYAGLGQEYGTVEQRFFDAPPKGFEQLIFLLEYKGRVIGQARTVIENDMAFFYALGIDKDFRFNGLSGEFLLSHRIKECFDRGAKNIFLQTAQDSRPEGFDLKHGFRRLFTGRYWIEGK